MSSGSPFVVMDSLKQMGFFPMEGWGENMVRLLDCLSKLKIKIGVSELGMSNISVAFQCTVYINVQ